MYMDIKTRQNNYTVFVILTYNYKKDFSKFKTYLPWSGINAWSFQSFSLRVLTFF